MSMIEHQVKELREMSVRQRNNAKVSGKVFFEIENALSQAADTIEALSAKLAAANMERSDVRYGEEKKLIEEMAEEIENCYGRETELSERAREYLLKADCSGGWIACEDRMPENFEVVLAFTEEKQIVTVARDGEDWVLYDQAIIKEKILAWQSLPEPYRP